MRGGGFALAVAVEGSKLSCKVSKFFADNEGKFEKFEAEKNTVLTKDENYVKTVKITLK